MSTLYTVAAFYKFVTLTRLDNLQSALQKTCQRENVFGTILLAPEGINATIVGKQANIESVIAFLRSNPCFIDLECKFSISESVPFRKMKVKIKKEIVTFDESIHPNQKTGIPVNAEEWNLLITSPDVLVIDTRNTYEVELGTFKNAIDPKTKQFTDFPNFVKNNLDPTKHKKIAMFCTGGIRCEKASAHLLKQGFESVYQLQGGILKYLKTVKPEDSLWEGKCFIFDDRITLDKESIQKIQ